MECYYQCLLQQLTLSMAVFFPNQSKNHYKYIKNDAYNLHVVYCIIISLIKLRLYKFGCNYCITYYEHSNTVTILKKK